MITSCFRIEINGDVQNCAKFINVLRTTHWNLSLDQEGYLIVMETEWAEMVELAATYDCELTVMGKIHQAA